LTRDYREEYIEHLSGRKITDSYERSEALKATLNNEDELQLLYSLKKEMKTNQNLVKAYY